jgi:hypothetical protein
VHKSLYLIVLIVIVSFALALYYCVFLKAGVGGLAFGVLVCSNPIVFTFADLVSSDLLFVLPGLAALVVSREMSAAPCVLAAWRARLSHSSRGDARDTRRLLGIASSSTG